MLQPQWRRRARGQHGRPPAGRGHDGPKASSVEVVATVILALTPVATTWSGYQASRWHGEQAIAFSCANAARLKSTRALDLADTQTEIDGVTFTQLVDADAGRQTRLAASYRKRFRPRVPAGRRRPIATKLLEYANAPLTPFAMPSYRLAATSQAERLQVTADAAAVEHAVTTSMPTTTSWWRRPSRSAARPRPRRRSGTP